MARVAASESRPSSGGDPAPYRALVHPAGARYIEAIDQRALPHAVVTSRIQDAATAALAIRKMWVRGAPLIGAVGAYGLALALDRDASDAALEKAHSALDATARPRSTCAGRSTASAPPSSRFPNASVRTPRGAKPTRSAARTRRSITRSGCMDWHSCATSREAKAAPST
jgi:hypothetical protein